MLDDRDYMRGTTRVRGTARQGWWSLTIVLLLANAAVFAIQVVAERSPQWQHFFSQYLTLSVHGLKSGFFWQPLTFQFLHANWLHLGANLLTIYFFGRVIEERLGQGRFLGLYLASGVFGGLLQVLGMWAWPTHFAPTAWRSLEHMGVVGASAGAFGLATAFAALHPEQRLTYLVYFIIPITMRAKYLLAIGLGLTLLGIALPSLGGNIAHLAHLGGILTGLIVARWTKSPDRAWLSKRPARAKTRSKALAGVESRRATAYASPALNDDAAPPPEAVTQEIDPILDKISAKGIHSLTREERRILQTASDRMRRR